MFCVFVVLVLFWGASSSFIGLERLKVETGEEEERGWGRHAAEGRMSDWNPGVKGHQVALGDILGE